MVKGSDFAFPVPVGEDYYGMSIRTWLAGQSLKLSGELFAGLLRGVEPVCTDEIGRAAVQIADALIAALNAEEKNDV